MDGNDTIAATIVDSPAAAAPPFANMRVRWVSRHVQLNAIYEQGSTNVADATTSMLVQTASQMVDANGTPMTNIIDQEVNVAPSGGVDFYVTRRVPMLTQGGWRNVGLVAGQARWWANTEPRTLRIVQQAEPGAFEIEWKDLANAATYEPGKPIVVDHVPQVGLGEQVVPPVAPTEIRGLPVHVGDWIIPIDERGVGTPDHLVLHSWRHDLSNDQIIHQLGREIEVLKRQMTQLNPPPLNDALLYQGGYYPMRDQPLSLGSQQVPFWEDRSFPTYIGAHGDGSWWVLVRSDKALNANKVLELRIADIAHLWGTDMIGSVAGSGSFLGDWDGSQARLHDPINQNIDGDGKMNDPQTLGPRIDRTMASTDPIMQRAHWIIEEGSQKLWAAAASQGVVIDAAAVCGDYEHAYLWMAKPVLPGSPPPAINSPAGITQIYNSTRYGLIRLYAGDVNFEVGFDESH